jgi:excisionase family DNA binding protein
MNSGDQAMHFDELPDVMTVDQVRCVLQLSETTMYSLVRAGTILSVKVGRQFRVTKRALKKFLGLDDELAANLSA